MPETPSDPLDRLGEASTSLAVSFCGGGPARGRLCDVLNPHREMSAPSLRIVTGVAGVAPDS
jgi:hypothetical protein